MKCQALFSLKKYIYIKKKRKIKIMFATVAIGALKG